jgi:hypothetical protein
LSLGEVGLIEAEHDGFFRRLVATQLYEEYAGFAPFSPPTPTSSHKSQTSDECTQDSDED